MLLRATTFCLTIVLPVQGFAEAVFALRTIRPEEIIERGDVLEKSGTIPGAYQAVEQVIGQEARVAVYAGRPIYRGDVRPPALVRRNALVELVYRRAGLEITAEGRSLQRASEGETIVVLNATSRLRVTGTVMADGRILVE